jgi:hypothetical protein
MEIKIITDIQDAQKLWNYFSPHHNIDDEWKFRYAFLKHLNFDLKFIVVYENEHPIALLPLQENTGKGLLPPYAQKTDFLEFFGGDDTDNNNLMVIPEHESKRKEIFKLLEKSIPKKTVLAPLSPDAADIFQRAHYEDLYILDLKKYSDHENFIDDKWDGNSRSKFKRNIRNLYKRNKIQIIRNRFSDLDRLFELNLNRYGESSSFNYSYRKEIFKELIKYYDVEMISICVNGKIEAVSYAINFNNIYYAMNMGVNTEINNIGKLLVLLQIDIAIEKKCTIYDAGKGESGWKEGFHFNKIPQYKYAFTQ